MDSNRYYKNKVLKTIELNLTRMKKIFILTLTYLILPSCSKTTTEASFWEFSSFRITAEALNDMDKVDIIYFSGSIPNYEKADYYRHLIAIKKSTNDTVNILTIFDHGITENTALNTYSYLSPNNEMNKMGNTDIYDYKLNGLTKVAQNPILLDDFFFKFPTVIGSVAIVR